MLLITNRNINLAQSSLTQPRFRSDEEAVRVFQKGWNMPNVWSFELLKLVYLALRSSKGGNKNSIINYITKNQPQYSIIMRQIDEYLNALDCFGIIQNSDAGYDITEQNWLDDSTYEITNSDLTQFERIYFSYFRFVEIENWFLEAGDLDFGNHNDNKKRIIKFSQPLFFFSYKEVISKTGKKKTLTDSFFLESRPDQVYRIPESNSKLMRFWDVFGGWSKRLNLSEKINLSEMLNVHADLPLPKNLSLIYFVDKNVSFDLNAFLTENYAPKSRIIHLPELVLNIAIKIRMPIETIKEQILEQVDSNPNKFGLQRTSKIFISGKEYIYPKSGNTFVSHLTIR